MSRYFGEVPAGLRDGTGIPRCSWRAGGTGVPPRHLLWAPASRRGREALLGGLPPSPRVAAWVGQGVPASGVCCPLGCVPLPVMCIGLGLFSRWWLHTVSCYCDFFPVLNLSSAIWEQELKAIILLALLCVIPLLNFCILKVVEYRLPVMI